MSVNVSVLESALNKLKRRLTTSELRAECFLRLATEIASPSDGNTAFRTWYEEVVAGFKEEISFNETVNLIKFCGLHFPRKVSSVQVMSVFLQNNFSFEVPANKEQWLSGIKTMGRDVAITQSSVTLKAKTRWGAVKNFVDTGAFRNIKVIKLRSASILPEADLSDLRRTHSRPTDLLHVECRTKQDRPRRPLLRQRSKSFDFGSSSHVSGTALSFRASDTRSDNNRNVCAEGLVSEVHSSEVHSACFAHRGHDAHVNSSSSENGHGVLGVGKGDIEAEMVQMHQSRQRSAGHSPCGDQPVVPSPIAPTPRREVSRGSDTAHICPPMSQERIVMRARKPRTVPDNPSSDRQPTGVHPNNAREWPFG